MTQSEIISKLMSELATASLTGKDTQEIKQRLIEAKRCKTCGEEDKDTDNAFMKNNNRSREDCIKFFNGTNTINYGDNGTSEEENEKELTKRPKKHRGIGASLTDKKESSHVQRMKANKIKEDLDSDIENIKKQLGMNDKQCDKEDPSKDNDEHIKMVLLAKKEIPDSEDEIKNLAKGIIDVDDIIHAYDPDDLAIIDSNTGEIVAHPTDSLFENKIEQIDEVMTVADRIKAAYRMVKMHNLMQRKLMIALRHHSTQDVLIRRAHRLALHILKQKLSGGKSFNDLPFSERARIEEIVKTKQAALKVLTLALIPRVREIEETRLKHHLFTKDPVQTKKEPEGISL